MWVVLAVDLVLDGLINQDPISEVLAELHSLPSDLKDLYDNMLGRIKPKYLNSSVKLFRIMLCVEGDRICPLALSLAHDGLGEALDIAKRGSGAISACDAERRIKDVTVWLKVRCAGLLEIRPRRPGSSVVEYIHLTAKEHLSALEILQYRGSQPFSSFNPYLQIIAAAFRLAKACTALTEMAGPVDYQHGRTFFWIPDDDHDDDDEEDEDEEEEQDKAEKVAPVDYQHRRRYIGLHKDDDGDSDDGDSIDDAPSPLALTESHYLLQTWTRLPHDGKLQGRVFHEFLSNFRTYARLMEQETKQTHTEMLDHLSQVVFRMSRQGSDDDNESAPVRMRYPDGWWCPLWERRSFDGPRPRTDVLGIWWDFCADDSLNAKMNSFWLTAVCTVPLELYLKEKARSTRLGDFCADLLSCIDKVDHIRGLNRSIAGLFSFCLRGLITRRSSMANWVIDLVAEIFQREYFGAWLLWRSIDGISLLDKRWASAFRFLAVASDAFVSYRCDVMQDLPEGKINVKNKYKSRQHWTLLFLVLSVETSLDAHDMQALLADLLKCGATISTDEFEANPHLRRYYDKETAKRKVTENPEVGVARVRKRLANLDTFSAVLQRAELDQE